MAVEFDRNSSQSRAEKYTKQDSPHVEANVHVNTGTNIAGLRLQVSGATGAAQLVQVLRILANRIEADFGV